MKIDLDQSMRLMEPVTLFNDDGQPIKTEEFFDDGSGKKSLTLAQVTARSLINAPLMTNQELAAEEQIRRYELATNLLKGGTQEISVDDLALLQKCISTANRNIVIAVQARRMLKGSD